MNAVEIRREAGFLAMEDRQRLYPYINTDEIAREAIAYTEQRIAFHVDRLRQA